MRAAEEAEEALQRECMALEETGMLLREEEEEAQREKEEQLQREKAEQAQREKEEQAQLEARKRAYEADMEGVEASHNAQMAAIKNEEDAAIASFEDVSRRRAEYDQSQEEQRQSLASKQKIKQDSKSSEIDNEAVQNRAKKENEQQDRIDDENRRHRREQGKTNNDATVREREIQRQKERDDADYADRQSKRQLAQSRDMSLISAKTGRERMKALDEYARGMELLHQKSKIAAETRESVDYAKKHGADDAAINRIQKEGEDAISELESEFAMLSSIRDKQLSQGGGLRSVVGENVGASEGLTDTWERIQQSAFGHISDPAADAVLMMDRNEAVRNATMMNFYKEWFPKIANNNSGLAAD
jgi:hypothetical protein